MARLFIGIKIENQLKLEDLVNSLQKQLQNSTINWVNPANFHLTLKFLGDVEDYYINSIKKALNLVSLEINSFTLQYNKTGYFGTLEQPKVIWFNFSPNETLNKLQQSIEKSMLELSFEPDPKKYSPHLTFARIKKIGNVNSFKEIFKSQTLYSDKIDISKFQLIESILKPSGPVYSTLAEFKLQQ